MSRKRETVTRADWEAFINLEDFELAAALKEDLLRWVHGEDCEFITYTVDRTGRLDYDSSPRPGDPGDRELVARIQPHVGSGVVFAKHLFVAHADKGADEQLSVFAYRTADCKHEMRGAFTNGDPIWEEDDEEAFRRAIGEIGDRAMNAQHTPGPWAVGCHAAGWHQIIVHNDENTGLLAEVSADFKESAANAALIAAAPELLEAAQVAKALIDDMFGNWPGTMAITAKTALTKLQEAIAKATN